MFLTLKILCPDVEWTMVYKYGFALDTVHTIVLDALEGNLILKVWSMCFVRMNALWWWCELSKIDPMCTN